MPTVVEEPRRVSSHKRQEEEIQVRVGIIGAGNVGEALATSAGRAGHAVTLSATDPSHAQAAAQATGVKAAASNRAAVEGADVVVLAVPHANVGAVLDEVGDALRGKVLVDATNRVNPADPGSVLDGTSAAEQTQARVPSARVVKAFNTAFASRLANPVVDGVPLDGFVAGDDAAAKAAVLDLVGSLGFRPIDAGPLVMARALEGMALLIISLQIRNNWVWQNGWKLVGPTTAAH
jgi:NADPH-dependent F420 reductase